MEKTLEDLIRHVYKKYSFPEIWWSKAHFEKRCTEIYVCEQVILKCMDSPFINPKDIIDDYQMILIYCSRSSDRKESIKKFNIMISTLDELRRFFE